MKFSFDIFIPSMPDEVFIAFTNYSNYQNMLPKYFPSVRVLSSRNDVSIVEEHMILGNKELIMMTKHVSNNQDQHDIFVIGGDAKGTHIIEYFKPVKNGTKLTVEADFKLKGKMRISSIFGGTKIETEYSKIIKELTQAISLT